MKNKQTAYLGDGLYIERSSSGVRLFTSNGLEEDNEVFMDQQVIDNFLEYIKRLKDA